MTPIEPLDPNLANKYPALQAYFESCDAKLAAGGEKNLTRENAIIANRVNGDGHFEILNQSPQDDFFCAAQVDWRNREMLIAGGKLSEKKQIPLGAVWMQDACALTKELVGLEELQNQPCDDTMRDPRLSGLGGLESVQYYLNTCNDLLQSYGAKYDRVFKESITLDKVRLENSIPQDGNYSLLFSSGAYQFFCEGIVDNFSHSMNIQAGHPKNEKIRASFHEELVDDCSLTRLAFGEDEILGTCQNRTRSERNWEQGVNTFKEGLFTGLLMRDLYRWFRRKPTLSGGIYRTIRHPVQTYRRLKSTLRNFSLHDTANHLLTWARESPSSVRHSIRTLGPRTQNWVRSLGPRMNQWVRSLPKRSMTGVRSLPPALRTAFLDSRLGTWSRPVMNAFRSAHQATQGGRGLALTGSTLGWSAVGFSAGVGLVVLAENVPRWFGAKKSVSDGMGWLIEEIAGKPSDETIDVLEHLGFGGWTVFKNKWGL